MNINGFLFKRKQDFLYERDYLLHLKNLVNLYDFIVKFEKVGSNIIYDKFYFDNYVIFRLKSIIWNKKTPNIYEYESILLKFNFEEIKNNKNIKWLLMIKMYEKIIQKKIIML